MKEGTFIENSAANSEGGAGIKAAQNVVDSKAEILITPRCGQNAADVLQAADIKIYKTKNQVRSLHCCRRSYDRRNIIQSL